MSDLLQEVDEMMRQEKLEKFWHENGNYIIGFVVLTILMTAGITGWKNWQYKQRTMQTEQLLEALEAEDFVEQADALSGAFHSDIKAVTLLTAAGRAMEDGDKDKAIEYYRQIAMSKIGSRDLHGLSVIMLARLSPVEGKGDSLRALQSVAGDQASPWRYHAFVEAALLEVSRNQDYAKARQYLKNVTDAAVPGSDLPSSLVERARSLDHIYALKQNAAASEARQEG